MGEIMSRATVEQITSDLSGKTYLGTADGATTVPFTYLLPDGTTVNADLTPNEKTALYAALTGDREALTEILLALRPKVARNTDDTLRNDVSAWYANAHNGGTAPGRVTSQMYALYDVHKHAQEVIATADAANAETSDDNAETPETDKPQTRQEKRDAAAKAAEAAKANA
jgi:hypothetical protein